MGVPTSEVGYTPAMPRREDHEVQKEHMVALGRKKIAVLCLSMFSKEADSDHYLLCAKVNFPPQWLNKSNKKTPKQQEEFFKVRLLNDESIRWLYTQRVKIHLSNKKENEIDVEKEWRKLYVFYNFNILIIPVGPCNSYISALDLHSFCLTPWGWQPGAKTCYYLYFIKYICWLLH